MRKRVESPALGAGESHFIVFNFLLTLCSFFWSYLLLIFG